MLRQILYILPVLLFLCQFQSVYAQVSTSNRVDQLLIHLKNIPENNKWQGNTGQILLESKRYTKNAHTLDGLAGFHDVPARDNYTVTATNTSTTDAFGNITELWGKWSNISIDVTSNELIFKREMPYIYNLNIFHSRINTLNPSIEAGEPVSIEILFKNPSGQKLRSRLVLAVKNSQTGSVQKIEKDITIEPFETRGFTNITFIPFEAGEYYYAPGIFVRQGFNQWTDTWEWPQEPQLHVTGAHRIINFAGYQWEVKAGKANPGGNYWSNDSTAVWIDQRERLHLSLQKKENRWYASEVFSTQAFDHGIFTFYIDAEPALYDPHVVVGLFLYKDDKNEIDIEFSRWGDAGNYQLGNYIIQPADIPGNQFRFPIITSGTFTTHRIIWKPDEILFSSWHGHHENPPAGGIIAQWQYAGNQLPASEIQLRVFINLWLFQAISPKSDKQEKLIINQFTYEPLVK
jgi:hypothetical protein